MKITIVGGDDRYGYLYDILKARGNEVARYFTQNAIWQPDDYALQNCDCVLLPVPISKNGVDIYSPAINERIALADFLPALTQAKLVLGGVVSSQLAELCAKLKVELHDIMELEELTIKNAVATAEGAVYLAMQHTKKTLYNSDCLVVGYGRIGKVLAKFLSALGANVTVATRRTDHLPWIDIDGYQSIMLADLAQHVNRYDSIISTAPALVLDEQVLQNVAASSLILDLASLPGSVDFAAAKLLGLNCLHALGLPSIIAPHSAATYIADTVEAFVTEQTNPIYDKL